MSINRHLLHHQPVSPRYCLPPRTLYLNHTSLNPTKRRMLKHTYMGESCSAAAGNHQTIPHYLKELQLFLIQTHLKKNTKAMQDLRRQQLRKEEGPERSPKINPVTIPNKYVALQFLAIHVYFCALSHHSDSSNSTAVCRIAWPNGPTDSVRKQTLQPSRPEYYN